MLCERFTPTSPDYQQLGIPSGRLKKALWPLVSKRLAQQLDSLEACDADYYRRYDKILRAHTYKPGTPWFEKVCSRVLMTQQLHPVFEFLAVERSETTGSTF